MSKRSDRTHFEQLDNSTSGSSEGTTESPEGGSENAKLPIPQTSHALQSPGAV